MEEALFYSNIPALKLNLNVPKVKKCTEVGDAISALGPLQRSEES